MTFKHVKFQDSAVMRSLERVAREKGLVKPEELVKEASLQKKADLTPTDNVLLNLLKLSEGLREAGFDKYADELETKALAYKRAQTLYETSKEKGEDLIDAAHPKKDHSNEGVEGSSAFDTIVEQHLNNVKVVEKAPTGKLASSKDILKAVRVVLAEDGDVLLDQIREQVSIILSSVRKLDSITSKELTFDLSTGYLPNLENLGKNPTVDRLKQMQGIISKMRWRLKPGTMFGVSEDLWSQIEPLQAGAEKAIAKAIDLRVKYNQLKSKELSGDEAPKPAAPAAPASNPVADKIHNAKVSLNGIAALVRADTSADAEDVTAVNAWISKIDAALKDLEARSSNMNPTDVDAALAKLTKDFARVRQEWA